MFRSTEDRLKGLDNFQRAELLRMKRTQEACSLRIEYLRGLTSALSKKIQLYERIFNRAYLSTLLIFAAIAVLNESPWRITSQVATIALLAICIFTEYSLLAIFSNHASILFALYEAEVIRYQTEIDSMGLHGSYSDTNEMTEDILRNLGFGDNLIGTDLKISPLDGNS
jgi:hypothetical protein